MRRTLLTPQKRPLGHVPSYDHRMHALNSTVRRNSARYRVAMSPRMTLGFSVLAVGLGVAALAGIPALIENRNVGDVVVVVGLAVALAGGAIMLSSIPAQRRNRAEAQRNREADLADLYAKRDRILAQLTTVRGQIEHLDRMAMSGRLASTALAALGTERTDDVERRAERRALEVERINLEADLAFNTNELARAGVTVAANARR